VAVHLFLSPHLDDVVLSCGGLIHRLSERGERVIILTVMAGAPVDDLPETPALRAINARWSSARQHVAERRAEDVRAALRLGARVVHLPLCECVFRSARSGDGTRAALYPDADSRYGDYDPADDARLILLQSPSPVRADVVAIYAPLCADQHVDHRLVRDWALVLTGAKDAPALKFYEEYPAFQNKIALSQALEYYRREIPALALELEIALLSEEDVLAKTQALRCCESVAQARWQTVETMEQALQDYLRSCGSGQPAERLWRVATTPSSPETAQTIDIIP
jgi:LmbE family N-acetylglucosaminyl deacetylase